MPYLKDNNHHHFGHIINKFRFAADVDAYQEAISIGKEMQSRAKLNMLDPLYGVKAHTEECQYKSDGAAKYADVAADYMFQCAWTGPSGKHVKSPLYRLMLPDFLKVVSTDFVYLNGDHIPTHQYSVTQYERDLRLGDAPMRDEHGRES